MIGTICNKVFYCSATIFIPSFYFHVRFFLLQCRIEHKVTGKIRRFGFMVTKDFTIVSHFVEMHSLAFLLTWKSLLIERIFFHTFFVPPYHDHSTIC